MIIPLSGTAGDDVEVTVLEYRYRTVGVSWGGWTAITVPPHEPGVPFNWSANGPDLGVGSYQIEFRAQDAVENETVVARNFSVVLDTGGGALTGVTGLTFDTVPTELSAGTDSRAGWRFTVGETDVQVNQLGIYGNSAAAFRLMIHRVSDGAVIASVVANSIAGSWVWESISPVTLMAGTQYTMSAARDNFAGYVPFLPQIDEVTFSPAITFDRVVYGGANDDMPTTVFEPPDAEWAEDYLFSNFRHVV